MLISTTIFQLSLPLRKIISFYFQTTLNLIFIVRFKRLRQEKFFFVLFELKVYVAGNETQYLLNVRQ